MAKTTRKPSKRSIEDRIGYDPDGEYPKVATVRISWDAEDERDREELTEDLKAYLTRSNSRIHAKNVTVLSLVYLVDGESINASELEEHRR